MEENDTGCCYAVQDEVRVHGPGQAPWEVYVVNGDADHLEKAADSTCCGGDADTTGDEQTPVRGCGELLLNAQGGGRAGCGLASSAALPGQCRLPGRAGLNPVTAVDRSAGCRTGRGP